MAPISVAASLSRYLCNLSFPPSNTGCCEIRIKSSPLASSKSFRQATQNPPCSAEQATHRRNLKPRFVCQVSLQETEGVELKAKAGDKIRVKGPLKVYHVPKNPEVDLSGKEGIVLDYVALYKGKPTTANLPYKIKFELELNGKPTKFFAHLRAEEFEVIG